MIRQLVAKARIFAAAVPLALLGACADDVTAPPAQVAGAFTVDARTAWVYISLQDSAVVAPTPSAAESAGWDIAFNATNVALNGGTAGPGGVTGACICQNAGATGEQVLAMTAESELADFEAVTSVPAGLTFTSDVFTAHRYYRYNIAGDHRISPTFDVYLIKRGADVYALQVTGYYSTTNQARFITFRYKKIA